jgi:hypothetical protein
LKIGIPARHPKNLFSVWDAGIGRILPFVQQAQFDLRHPSHTGAILKQESQRFKPPRFGD